MPLREKVLVLPPARLDVPEILRLLRLVEGRASELRLHPRRQILDLYLSGAAVQHLLHQLDHPLGLAVVHPLPALLVGGHHLLELAVSPDLKPPLVALLQKLPAEPQVLRRDKHEDVPVALQQLVSALLVDMPAAEVQYRRLVETLVVLRQDVGHALALGILAVAELGLEPIQRDDLEAQALSERLRYGGLADSRRAYQYDPVLASVVLHFLLLRLEDPVWPDKLHRVYINTNPPKCRQKPLYSRYGKRKPRRVPKSTGQNNRRHGDDRADNVAHPEHRHTAALLQGRDRESGRRRRGRNNGHRLEERRIHLLLPRRGVRRRGLHLRTQSRTKLKLKDLGI